MKSLEQMQNEIIDYAFAERRRTGSQWPKPYMTYAATVVLAKNQAEWDAHRRADNVGVLVSVVIAGCVLALVVWFFGAP